MDRLILVPMILALAAIWATLVWYTFAERSDVLERARGQLSSTIATLADFNELAEQYGGSPSGDAVASRTAAIWRALLQYPSASIWVEQDGLVTAGEAPTATTVNSLQVDETRTNFSVHVALPEADALADWRKDAKYRAVALLLVSIGFLLLSKFLARAVQQRASAENEALSARDRAAQLAEYREQLEDTVAKRTGELNDSNSLLGKELAERKAAETALREHDALLNVVTKSAAELLGSHQEESISIVLALIGRTVAVSRVQLKSVNTDDVGHMRSAVRFEWCAPGVAPMIDNPALQNMDLTVNLPRAIAPVLAGDLASFFITDVSGTYRGLFEQAQMRSFLQIPVMIKDSLWGVLDFIDSGLSPVSKTPG